MELLANLLLPFVLAMGGLLGFGAQSANIMELSMPTESSDSVELGILELSPRGHEGGYAMPASGDSIPPGCALNLLPTMVDEGEMITATLTPTGSADRAHSGKLQICDTSFSSCTQVTTFPQYTSTTNLDTSGLAVGNYAARATQVVVEDDYGTGEGSETKSYLMSCSALFSIESSDMNECQDGADNTDSEDSVSDASDPGCWTDPTDPSTYNPNDDDESDPPTPEEATASMEVCDKVSTNPDGINCVSGPNGSKTITEGTELQINWSSTEADDCTFTSWDGNDGIGDSEERFGTDTTINAPLLGSSVTYRLTCSNPDDVSPEQRVTVTTSAGVTSCPGGGTLTADPSIIRRGDSSTLEWTPPTDTAACTIEGPNLGADDVTTITPPPVTSCGAQPLITEVDPLSTATYTLTCDGTQVDQTTIRVVPSLEET